MQSGGTLGNFDTWKQAVVFPANEQAVTQVNYSSRGLHPVSWALPQAGKNYRVTARTSGGAKLRLQVRDPSGTPLYFDSGELQQGESKTFAWPDPRAIVTVYATSGVGSASTVSGELVEQD